MKCLPHNHNRPVPAGIGTSSTPPLRDRSDNHHCFTGPSTLPVCPITVAVVPALDESHDFAHPVESDTAWSESYYFNCYDPQTDSGFFSRIGIRPNEGTIDAGCSFWLPDGGLAGLGAIREQKVMIDDDLVVGPNTYVRLAPLKQWRIKVDGDAPAGHTGRSGGETVAIKM